MKLSKLTVNIRWLVFGLVLVLLFFVFFCLGVFCFVGLGFFCLFLFVFLQSGIIL